MRSSQRLSTYSNEDFQENSIINTDTESDNDDGEDNSKSNPPPIVNICPPEEEHLYLIQ